MKKFMLVALMLTVSAVNAAEISVLETAINAHPVYSTTASAEFHMDLDTNEGFVIAKVIGRRTFDSRRPTTVTTLFSKKVKVEGLMLMGDQAVYQGAEGNVVCGTMGLSRVFKVPTLNLNGNCVLNAKIVNSSGKKLSVTLVTK